MRRTALRLLAASSLLLAVALHAAERPRYGGTLRVQVSWALHGGDIGASYPGLVSEALTRVDDRGAPQPMLALSWHSDPGFRQWQFLLRRAVKFHDGSDLTSEVAAAALDRANLRCRASGIGESVLMNCSEPAPNLPAELAAVPIRTATSATGPFRVEQVATGKHVLVANDQHWGGRPFLDSIEITAARGSREQRIALETGRADVVDLSPDQLRRASQDGLRVVSAPASRLLALDCRLKSPAAARFCAALAAAVDRSSLNNVLFQRQGEPAGSLLPAWMSGYAFTFPAAANLERARLLRAESGINTPVAIGYAAGDPLARVVAERIALNAREAGISLAPAADAGDLRVAVHTLSSANPWAALVADSSLAAPPQFTSATWESLLVAEQRIVPESVVPLVHLPAAFAVSQRVRGFRLDRTGQWRLADVWLDQPPPEEAP